VRLQKLALFGLADHPLPTPLAFIPLRIRRDMSSTQGLLSLDIALGGPLGASFLNSMLYMLEIVQVRSASYALETALLTRFAAGIRRAE
jgi:hypothetical protein